MDRVIWHITMSLDGFIAGRDHEMEWVFRAFRGAPPNEVGEQVRRETGAILAGRRWYDAASERYDGVAGIYGGRWSGPVYVLTHRPDDAPDDPTVTFVSDGIESAVATGRDAADGKNLEIFGADTARQCLEAGLIDEIVVHIVPVLLGDGVRLYDAPGAGPVELTSTASSESGQVLDLRFRVDR
jgi:dihydrofolate reductase